MTRQAGTFEIESGSDSGSVTGLDIGSSETPRRVFVDVQKPAGGLNMCACVVNGTLSRDGFDFTLSGAADNDEYRLNYCIVKA